MVQLRDAGLEPHLLDARVADTLKLFPEIAAFNLEEGMLVRWGGRWHHGADAIHLIAKLSRRSPLRTLLSNHRVAQFIYPMLRAGRRLALAVLGRPKIR